MKVTNLSAAEWTLDPGAATNGATRARRGKYAPHATRPVLPPELLPRGATLGATGKAEPLMKRAQRGPGVVAPLELAVETKAGERALLAVRMPSGALRFVAPVERTSRGARAATAVSRFIIPPPRGAARAARRGLIADAIEWVVVEIGKKVIDEVAGRAMRVVAAAAEKRWWGERREGLYRVESAGPALRLRAVKPDDVTGPALLLLHGTFSHAESAFGDLLDAPGDFFAEARRAYGDRIYAWNHFSVSKSPEENARELLDALPDRAGGVECDVITHSRGGLVLRTLVELAAGFGAAAPRFKLRRAVLVAAPNGGTPLATPGRWEETLGFVSNVLELFTPNPWTMAASFVADGLVWLAARVAGDLPGLASMDAGGETIAALQESSVLETGSYAALAANFHPTEAIVQRLLDVGVDAFFQGANDLVVPAEGSWLTDGAGEMIPAESIGCFGRGGNLDSEEAVHHLNFFRQVATVDFLKRALGLPVSSSAPAPLDPATRLPTRSLLSLASRRGAGGAAIPPRPRAALPVPPAAFGPDAARALALPDTAYADRTLHLMILEVPVDKSLTRPTKGAKENPVPLQKMMIATFSNARVVEVFPTKSPKKVPGVQRRAKTLDITAPELAGHRFQKIIETHKRIRMCLNGDSKKNGEVPELPTEDELGDLGEWLFRALFIGDVRRLYDAARAEQRGRPLNIVLTCAIPWIAALPWEFAYDPMRRKYLASEEVHFTRGVMASVPAEVITRRSPMLRLLVVSAQPADASLLSIEEERARIRHAFKSLTDSGLVKIEPIMDASAQALQDCIMAEQVQGRSFDVVHFIGHGEFDLDSGEGRLLLVNADGSRHELEMRPLREMLQARGIHLVFLNACESGTGDVSRRKKSAAIPPARNARGIAQALVEGGIPAVVANQYTVLDSAALAFADAFYRALALGASLGQAAREARIALNYAVDGDAIDWAVPVLYARDPDARLCAPTMETVRQAPERCRAATWRESGSMARSARAPVVSDRIRVGIADISKYFPPLPKILRRFNAVQAAFEFVPVAVAIPLGVWQQEDLGPEEGGKVRYLLPERFTRRMKHHPQRLGVHYLVCATHHMMKGHYYGWWSENEKERVMIFSTGGLALPWDGKAAGRVVANAIMQVLAAQIAQEAGGANPIHPGGIEELPLLLQPGAGRAIPHRVQPLRPRLPRLSAQSHSRDALPSPARQDHPGLRPTAHHLPLVHPHDNSYARLPPRTHPRPFHRATRIRRPQQPAPRADCRHPRRARHIAPAGADPQSAPARHQSEPGPAFDDRRIPKPRVGCGRDFFRASRRVGRGARGKESAHRFLRARRAHLGAVRPAHGQ